jgi:hypothetical protein
MSQNEIKKNPGKILKLQDKRLCIAYNNQPLLESKGKLMLYLCDEKHNILKNDAGKSMILLKDAEIFRNEITTIIGYID